MKIRLLILILAIAAGCHLSPAEEVAPYESMIPLLGDIGFHTDTLKAGDNIVDCKGRKVLVRVEGNRITHIGCPIFTPAMREAFDSRSLDYIECAYLHECFGISTPEAGKIEFVRGSWADFDKAPGSNPALRIDHADSRVCTLAWKPDETSAGVELTFPISYTGFINRSRGEIELQFIDGLKAFEVAGPRPVPALDFERLEMLSDSLLVLRGKEYHIPEVSSDVYLSVASDGTAGPVTDFDSLAPLAFADLFMISAPTGADSPTLHLRVISHTYGHVEECTVGLEQFMQYCLSRGCTAFWGKLGENKGGDLAGCLFLQNSAEAYNHVIRLYADSKEMPSGTISATASLFIPTNNVKTLYDDKSPAPKHKNIRLSR